MNRILNVGTYARKVARVFNYTIYVGCVAHCFLEYVGDFVMCVGPSMEPAIYSLDIVFAEHISVHRQKISRGDIVVTKSPYNPKHNICKRVIALPGDKVRSGFFSQIVPMGYVWVEGDNKYNSSDSRDYGPIPQGLIRGRVIFRLFPFNSIKMFSGDEKSCT